MAQLALDGMESTTVSDQALLMDVLVECGLAVTPRGEVTRGQARKLIEGNSISVNGEKVTDSDARLTMEGSLHGRFNIIQKGKKHHHLVVVAPE